MVRNARTVLVGCLFLQLAAAGAARAEPITFEGASPFTLSATGGEVTVYYVGSDAAYESLLFLSAPGNQERFFPNHATRFGARRSLGRHAPGTELTFGLHVLDTGIDYFTGPASRNPDAVLHARAVGWTSTRKIPTSGVLVGFEDLFSGGDRDFNDFLFVVSNATLADVAAVPEPATLLLVGSGIAGLAARRRKRRAH